MHRTINDLAIGQKYKLQLENAEARLENRFFKTFVEPVLYCPENDVHVPFFDRKQGTFSQLPLEQIIESSNSEDCAAILPDTQLFTNPLKFANYNSSGVGNKSSSGFTPPSLRVTNGGFLVLTFEHDGEDPAALEQQLDWFAGKKDACLFNQVHIELCKYADYRGYCVAFSGHKSLHIHVVFDIRHLSSKLAKGNKGALRSWSIDVPDSLLASLHRIGWCEVVGIIQRELNIDLEFDQNLSAYYTKRRSPWGTRIIDKQNNIHGFDVGDTITQVVVQERILSRSSSKSDGVLFSSDKVSKAVLHTSHSQNRSSPNPVMADEEIELLNELSIYLRENGWSDYPKPVILKYQEPHNKLYCQNHAGDQHPNTYIQGDYRTIVPAGVGAPQTVVSLPNDQTLDETLIICQQRIAVRYGRAIPVAKNTTARPRKWPRKYAEQATSIKSARAIQGSMLAHIPSLDGTTFIQGLPGSGKTHNLMTNILERRWDDDAERHAYGRSLSRGFIVIASPTYEQAAAKRQEYLNLDTGNTCAVLIKSTSKFYEMACQTPKMNHLDRHAIGRAGYSNFIDGVKKLQPDVFSAMTKLRDDMWRRDGHNLFHRNGSILFMTHEMVKHWSSSRLSKAFLHPEFPEDYTEDDIESCCRDMSFYRVIYDEVATDDLASIDAAPLVKISHSVRKHHDRITNTSWDTSSLTNQVAAYDHVLSGYKGLGLNFDDCNRIIRMNYRKKKDRYSVNAMRFPFGKGTNNKNIYAQRNGVEYYCKPKNWWHSLGCPVIILTTEDLPRTVFNKIDSRKNNTRSLLLMNAPHLFQEYVPVIFDERARTPGDDRKPNCRDLAVELLNSSTNFVIGNKLKEINSPLPSPTCPHISAKGRNDLKDKCIATILTYPSMEQYDEWAILGSAFDIPNPVQLAYSDTVLQNVGRNLGFRRDPKAVSLPHRIYIKPSLYRDLGYFNGSSQIPFHFYNQATSVVL